MKHIGMRGLLTRAPVLIILSLTFSQMSYTAVSQNTEKRDLRAQTSKPDNTAVNFRDKNALTAEEQAYGSEKDVKITRLIRKEIVAQKDFSTYAKNIKIITLGGQVFLRGPVSTAAEKTQIEAHAGKIAGAQNIKNELEVVSK